MPKISIIIPVYNVENHLNFCVNSILKQTFTDFELILVDDGSNDNSGAICDNYASYDSRVIVIHKNNGGVSAARNTGLETASGEYITFVDSDDWLSLNFFEEALKIVEKKVLDIYMGGFIRVDNTQKNTIIGISNIIDASQRFLNEAEYTELLCNGYIASSCGKLIRRNLIGTLRFPNNMCFGEDLAFIFNLLKKNPKCYAVPTPYYYYCDTANSLTKQCDKKKLTDVLATYYILLDFSKKNNYQTIFLPHIQERWIHDFIYLQNIILQSKISLFQKYNLLKLLLSAPQLKEFLYHSNDKYCRVYCTHPILLICYTVFLSIRNRRRK